VIIHGALPPRDVLLRFLADNPDKASKRDISKAFGLKGDKRIELKALLREMEDDGLLEKKRKALVRPGALPPMTVLDITTRDKDGGLIGRPAEWPEDAGVAPAVSIRQSAVGKAKGKVPVGGLGDRVLAKIFASKENSGPAYTARIVKVLDRKRDNNAALGVFRASADGGGRIMPIERRGEELQVDTGHEGEAKDGDLVEVEVLRIGRFGLPRAEVKAVIGSVATEKAISMIAIHAHGIPYIFPDSVIREADAAGPPPTSQREDLRQPPLITIYPADAMDHDDAVHYLAV
jgi:ribonuclease R